MVKYPTEFPKEAIASTISFVKDGFTQKDLPIFVEGLWNVAGFALFTAFGEAIIGGDLLACCPQHSTIDDKLAVSYLESATTASDGVVTALPIPWLSLAKWALQLILSLLNPTTPVPA